MELFKRYMAASSMGVVALVCVLVGLLGVTVLRPPTHQVSSVESPTDLIMTRGNVLSIVKDDVTVTATSKSGAPVTLSIGTTQDVKGSDRRCGLHRGHRRRVGSHEAQG